MTMVSDMVLSGSYAKYISIACAEFEKRLDVNWQDYNVTVTTTDDYVHVNFSAKNMDPGLRGAPKGAPGFDIKIRKKGYEVMESQFVR